MPKREKYKPTPMMAESSHYDKEKADRAVNFIQCLCHTKGSWAGKKFILLPWQERIIRDVFGTVKENGYRQFNTAYVEIPKKQGKQLALDTPIATPNGWSTMEAIQVGDLVFDENGQPCHVVAKSEVDDTEEAYKLTFRDGSFIIAGERHLWDVEYIKGKTTPKLWTTGEIYRRTKAHKEKYKNSQAGANRSLIRIPVTKPLELDEKELPVDPYLYGYWLGNGNSTKPEITVRSEDIFKVRLNIPYDIKNLYPQKGGGSWIFKYDELKPILLSSFRDKKIESEYLRASKAQRWRLLQGLMDSDGCVSKKTTKSQGVYVSTIRNLAESVRELLWSLGIKNSMKEEPSTRYGVPTGETLYVIRFTAFEDMALSGLDRKLSRLRERRDKTRSSFHYLKSIEVLDEKVKMQCIQVDSKSHCYLAGRSMVPTHNSELAAAVALYLLCADGEQRAEIYGCAADRQQASIVFEVAADMVRMSPALSKRVKILSSTKRLIYAPTNSFYQVLSAEAYSKHGFNIHGVVFDELHTQPDRKLFDVMTKGSGDARTQPLYFLITTAGTDTASICYEVHSKAKDILEGRKHDPTFYPVIYGADQEDDWTDPKVWAKANPSLGETITLEKVKAACDSARQNPAEENAFRQLRLNQWVKQAVRWMPMEKWNLCSDNVSEDSLLGRVCYGGLDLSSTTDITAFVLVFPPTEADDRYIIKPYFWIPEENVDLRVKRDHVPYDLWERQGFLMTTEGNVVHYGFIEKFIETLGEKYNIKEIAFDRWGAVQMSQNLEAMGFTVVPFGQGFKDMSPPTKELMKLVLEKRIAHGAHPVLSWMMDNIFIRTDPAGNIKPDKEKSTEKIDGAVATIMALDRAIRNGASSEPASVYDVRGVFCALSLLNVEIHLKLFNNVHMKKFMFASHSLATFNSSPNKPIYKSFKVNGEIFNRWIVLDTIRKYDTNGSEIYQRDSDGYEEWHKYDANGKCIHYKDSNGGERWYEYDANGNEIHYKDSDGYEEWHKYDAKGNKIYYKDSDDYEWWSEYDAKGKEIHYKNSNGFERWYEYDANGNEIHYKNSDGDEKWYEYDGNGNKIHFWLKDGFERWYEYDSNDNEIHSKDSDGYEEWYQYDANGKCIHYKDSKVKETLWKYNDKGKLIYHKEKDRKSREIVHEYDDNGNLIYCKSPKEEYWSKYDDKGNNIYTKYSDGSEAWFKYNDDGKWIYKKHSNGYERWIEYDDNGYKKLIKDTNGNLRKIEYDSNGNLISRMGCNNNGKDFFYVYEYYPNGKQSKMVKYTSI